MDIGKLTISIQNHEGLRLKPYFDTVGKCTIGYGRNLTDDGITADEATYLLSNDIQSAIREAQAQSWWPYVANDESWARAMVELLFNMGANGVAGFKDMLVALKGGDGISAANALLNSKYATQVGQRSKDIAALFTDNDQAPSA